MTGPGGIDRGGTGRGTGRGGPDHGGIGRRAGRGGTGAGLRLAVTTFTVLPLPAGPVDRATAGRAMLWAPLVGAGLGAAVAAPATGLRALTPGPAGALLVAALAVAALAGLTRGLHLDGLADTADGLASYRRGPAVLDVLRRSDIGPAGVATLVLTLLVQVGALAVCLEAGRAAPALVLAAVAGRLAVVHATTPGTPPARPDGLGAAVAGTVPLRFAMLATAAVAAACGVPAALGRPALAVRLVVALAAGLLAAWLLRRHAVRRFGGVTGDVLGALVETATTTVLVVTALG